MRAIHTIGVSALFALAATAAIAISAGPALAQSCASSGTPCFQGLGFLGVQTAGSSSSALGVSANGSVIVGSASANGSTEAVTWINGTISGLGFLPGCTGFCSTQANGVSSDGSVVVGAGSLNGNTEQGFRWANGVITALPVLSQNYTYTQALGANSDGSVIVGDSSGQPVEWAGGSVTALPTCTSNFGCPPVNSSQANAVNANGSVIVGVCCQAGGLTATEWLNGTFVSLPTGSPAAPSGAQISVSYASEANAVNSTGSAIAGANLVAHLGGPTTGKPGKF